MRPLALLFVCLLAFFGQSTSVASVRLIRVPLTSAITQEAGPLSQPVISYYASVGVGTPAREFKIQFDLDTDELFVPHYSWNPLNRNLHYSNGFQCARSSSCVKEDNKFNIEYQHVKMTGKRYEDLVALTRAYLTNSSGANTSMSSYPVSAASWRQKFLAISSASDGRFYSLPIDGFFGLGLNTNSQTGIRNMLTNLYDAKLVELLQFSFWFNPVLDSSHGGELILGGVDEHRYRGQMFWHKITSMSSNKWLLGLQQVLLGGQIIAASGSGRAYQAKFSTGLSDLYGPRDEVTRIYSYLGATRSPTGLQLIDCRRIPSLPYITFTIDGIPYNLPPSNYIRKTVEGRLFRTETCYIAIQVSNEDRDTWTLSTPFLSAYYSVFDITYRQIGFAALA